MEMAGIHPMEQSGEFVLPTFDEADGAAAASPSPAQWPETLSGDHSYTHDEMLPLPLQEEPMDTEDDDSAEFNVKSMSTVEFAKKMDEEIAEIKRMQANVFAGNAKMEEDANALRQHAESLKVAMSFLQNRSASQVIPRGVESTKFMSAPIYENEYLKEDDDDFYFGSSAY